MSSSFVFGVVLRPDMTVRMPQSLLTGHKRETGWSVLDYEILQQKAQTLGTLGRQVEQTLAALRAYDAGGPGADRVAQRCTLLDDAAERVWALMIQRELCGFRYWEAVVKEYDIPGEVLSRVGQCRRKKD
jgi:hypothetical protein